MENTWTVYLSGEIHTDWRERIASFMSLLIRSFRLMTGSDTFRR